MTSTAFLSIQFISLLAVVILSNSEKAKYTACSNSFQFSCGQIQNVGYPFWGNNRPVYCGISDLLLRCNNNSRIYLTIKMLHQDELVRLQVLGINTSSHTMDVSLNRLFNRCHLQGASKTIFPPSLKPASGYTDIILFYGCTGDCYYRYYSKTFSCSNGDGTSGTAYYFGNTSDISRIASTCSCNNSVTFLVDKRVVDDLSHRTDASLLNVLNKWTAIKMEYKANFSACSKCQESGGWCGSDRTSDQFVCYCRDGPDQPLVCSEPVASLLPSASKPVGRQKILFGSGAAASLVGTMMLVALIICVYKRRKTSKFSFLWSRRTIGDQNVAAFIQSYGSLAPKRYTYADIKKMTNSFSDKLGEGGFGSVYKGRLQNGRFVAVKKLKVLKGDGKDFINEVLSISRTNHVNVVTLLGFCFEGNRRALVFEFLPNGSLEKFIYGKEIRQSLQWETVFNIAIGIARGLDYLHRGCNIQILHFDIKPHNILLDAEFRPKISDFGVARFCPPQNSMISMSEARGTIGYIAPEVFCRNFGGISHKSDVYSYGMMLIDLVCGRNNPTNEVQYSSELYFPEWIYNRLEPMEKAAIDEVMGDGKKELERKMILVSLWCIQPYPSNRPPMNRVVEMLEGPFESLQMPPKPHSPLHSGSVFDASLMSTA